MNAITPAFPWASVGGANGWQELNARRLFKEVVVRSRGDEPLASATQGQGIVARDDLDIQVWNPESDTSNYKRVEPGQFVISLRSFQGGFEISRIIGILSPAYTTLHPLRPDLNEFYRWFFKSVPFITAVNSVASGIRQGKAIKFEDFASLSLPVPPAKDAAIIAAYLDRETGRIDALVARLERLIALLTEKRQAVISHAVTKGLNPAAPMKDSGIDWLGEVPAHWETVAVRRIADSVTTGGTPSGVVLSEDETAALPWFTPSDFRSLRLETAGKSLSRDTIENEDAKVFHGGSVLLVGIGATLGKVGKAVSSCSANQQINCIGRLHRIAAEFLTLSLSAQLQQMKFLSNASTIGILNQEKTKEVMICLPPMDEQREIVERLERHLDEIGVAVSRLSSSIAVVKERRAALISAAVTGQIPLADMVADPAPEATA
jgi:type I restriction enzyme S subunit